MRIKHLVYFCRPNQISSKLFLEKTTFGKQKFSSLLRSGADGGSINYVKHFWTAYCSYFWWKRVERKWWPDRSFFTNIHLVFFYENFFFWVKPGKVLFLVLLGRMFAVNSQYSHLIEKQTVAQCNSEKWMARVSRGKFSKNLNRFFRHCCSLWHTVNARTKPQGTLVW